MTLEIRFQHWDYEIPDELLVRYGSPFFSRADAGAALREHLLVDATMINSYVLNMTEHQVLCANEAFSEAAIADPLADLRVWDEWETGLRVFPYPGRFSRLGLTRQEGKTSSPSSVGVLGEILAGLFAQAYIAPQVLVRVIRHWPDLIFYSHDDIYAFVESKAFSEKLDGPRLADRVPDRLLKDLLCDAVSQLNADPHLEVWGAFTGVLTVQPHFSLAVTFLRLTPSSARRQANPRTVLPASVVRGVAERSLAQAAALVTPETLMVLGRSDQRDRARSSFAPNKTRISRSEAEALLVETALSECEVVLADAGAVAAISSSRTELHKYIAQLVKDCIPYELHSGRRFFEIKESSQASTLQEIRVLGDASLYMANLSMQDIHHVKSSWRPAWENAKNPLALIDGFSIWRGGGAAYCIGPLTLANRTIRIPSPPL